MSHRVLHDILDAISSGGSGLSRLTATATGTQIPSDNGIQFVVPTWSNADYILILPSPVPGRVVILAGAATGGELRTSDPATIGINGGTGASAESAVAAGKMIVAICESSTSWKAFGIASDGTTAGLEAAA